MYNTMSDTLEWAGSGFGWIIAAFGDLLSGLSGSTTTVIIVFVADARITGCACGNQPRHHQFGRHLPSHRKDAYR